MTCSPCPDEKESTVERPGRPAATPRHSPEPPVDSLPNLPRNALRIRPAHPGSEEGPRRGRPRTDIRTIVDAALYKTRTAITWRELPAEFGSWQTALRRHRQLVASSQWDEITRTLAERDLPQ
ncbi:transposase [Brachybacterium sacelli]|uniref:transposase n=1 Tax=Brachybacterium sacelli TaxID=173364 RepID=UPI003159B5B8